MVVMSEKHASAVSLFTVLAQLSYQLNNTGRDYRGWSVGLRGERPFMVWCITRRAWQMKCFSYCLVLLALLGMTFTYVHIAWPTAVALSVRGG